MSEPLMKVKLQYPIVVKEEDGKELKLDELTVQRLKVKHLRALPDDLDFSNPEDLKKKIKPKDLIPLLASMCGLSEEQMDEVDIDDLSEIAGKLGPLLEGLQGIGKK